MAIAPSITVDTSSIHKLPNGLTVLLEPLPYLRTASTGIWIATGSANEEPALAGVSHFLEHLFFKGTSTRSARQLMEAIESKGGHLNAFTSRDYTCLYAKMLGEHVGTAIEILADILKDSQLFDFEKERNVILEEIASIDDVPEDHVHDVLTKNVWPSHALGMPITGTKETMSGMTIDDVRAYYRHWYRPDNLIVSVAGSFDPEIVLAQIEREFGALEPGGAKQPDGAPAFTAGIQQLDSDITQNHLCFAFPGPGVHDPRRFVYNMLSNALGGGSTSRLFESIREQEGLAYSIYGYNSTYWRTGSMGVYAAVAPENLKKTYELAFAEIRKMREEPLPQQELELNREQLKGSVLMTLESTFNRMTRMAKSYMYHGRIITVDEIIAGVESVTAEQIQELACDRYTADQCALVSLGPIDGVILEEVPL
ncbi:MAG TPA: pitrilysin family protein [Candidatus Hydrogenedentes bacterium]|nr:pitrilysin family protein [Candidatus Hydrogenedentota bacterium]